MTPSPLRLALLALVLSVFSAGRAGAQPKPLAEGATVEPNVVYGMYSGLALVLDVHTPATPNGYGVIFISGSGWQAPTTYDATPLKQNQIPIWGPSLLKAGYTVFALNHRAVPRFHYPGAVEDVQRAVRFVRHHAKDYRIDPTRIGGMGGSSGGHLIALTAMLAATGIADDPDPVNREPATLQAIVLRATPTDLVAQAKADTGGGVTGFLEFPWPSDPANLKQYPKTERTYREASPSSHVSPTSPPTLLIHGDADESVPFDESVAMEAALKKAGVPAGLVRVPGGAHGADFGAGTKPRPDWPDFLGSAVRWYDTHLRRS
ncbi:MAG: alpha/beta hydrolase [Vicinamibacteraceae bacterium]